MSTATLTAQHLVHPYEIFQSRESGTQICPVARMSFDKPALISLGGIDAVDVSNARKFAERRVWDLLGDGVYTDSFRQYAASYETEMLDVKHHPRLIAEYYARGETSRGAKLGEALASDLLEKQFRPAIADIRDLSAQARADAFEDTSRLMGNLNFFTFSLGTIVIRHIHDGMAKLLEEKGYSAQEIPQLMGRVKVLSIGEMAHWKFKTKDWHFKSVHLASHEDEMLRPMAKGHTQDFAQEPVRLEKPLPNLLMVHCRLPKTAFHFSDDTSRDKLELAERTDPTGHAAVIHTRQRFTDQIGTLFTTTMMQSTLRNMILTSKEGRTISAPEELLQATPMENNVMDYLAHSKGYGYTDRVAALPIHSNGRN